VDQAALYALGDSPDGLVLPTPLYGPGTVFSNAGLNYSGYVSPGVDYLSDDVNIPTSTSTYLAFPTKILDLSVSYQDGDADHQIGPYQSASFDAQSDLPGTGLLQRELYEFESPWCGDLDGSVRCPHSLSPERL